MRWSGLPAAINRYRLVSHGSQIFYAAVFVSGSRAVPESHVIKKIFVTTSPNPRTDAWNQRHPPEPRSGAVSRRDEPCHEPLFILSPPTAGLAIAATSVASITTNPPMMSFASTEARLEQARMMEDGIYMTHLFGAQGDRGYFRRRTVTISAATAAAEMSS